MKLSCIDFLGISEHFTEEEMMVQKMASEFVSKEVMPIIEENYKKGTFPKELISKISKQGFLGCNLPTEYGCGGMSSTAYGLICQELERADSGVRSFVSVQGSLVMYPIYTYGSEEQRKKWLPKMAKGEIIGCFGLKSFGL